jgi:hypothetical protein
LGKTSVQVLLGLFPLPFDFLLSVKFLLHFLDLPLKLLVLLIPLPLLLAKQLGLGVLLKVELLDVLVKFESAFLSDSKIKISRRNLKNVV